MSTTGQPPVPPATAPGPLGPLRMTPGRWVALAIGVPAALALIGWTGFSLVTTVARGSYPFSYTVPVDHGQVALNIMTGNVTLRQGAGSTAQLTGTVRYGLIRPAIDWGTTPTGANIGMNCSGFASNCEMSATLDVPPNTGVTLWSNGGDVSASGFSKGMSLSAGGGNVNVSNLAGNLQLDTGGGDLTGNGLTGTIQIATEGGNVNASDWTGSGTTMHMDTGGGNFSVNGLTGDFTLLAGGGHVNASGLSAPTSAIDSGGGDVTLAFTNVPQSLAITAVGGNVTLILPPGGTKYDISTPNTQGNVNIPSSLIDSHSTAHKITIDSGGGDITVSQGAGPAANPSPVSR